MAKFLDPPKADEEVHSPAQVHESQSVSKNFEKWFFDEQTKQKDSTTKAKIVKIYDSKPPPKKNRLFPLSATPQKLRRKVSQNSQNETQLAHPPAKTTKKSPQKKFVSTDERMPTSMP